MIVDKRMQPDESKIKKYAKIVDDLVTVAQNENVKIVKLSAEFVPILAFSDIKRKPLDVIAGEYLYGSYNDIDFYITPDYVNAGKIGNTDITLVA